VRAVSLSLALGLFALRAAADAPVLEGAERVDGIAAVVGGLAPAEGVIAILRSDVELRARIALSGAGAADPSFAPLPAPLLRATLAELVGEALIAAEAQRLALEPPTQAELEVERARLAARAGGAPRLVALLDALGASNREIAAVIKRRAVVSAFLKANLEGTLEVTPSELSRAYEDDDHPFKGKPLEEVAEPLRQWLGQRRLEQSVAKWVESLRDRTAHKVLVEY
jgi:hypothetical protein